jgi:hypothetical protein
MVSIQEQVTVLVLIHVHLAFEIVILIENILLIMNVQDVIAVK